MRDIKWFLYRYRQLVEAKKNTERAIEVLTKKLNTPHYDENWFIKGKGGFPTSPQERTTILDDEDAQKIDHLKRYLQDLTILINAIESAHKTLNKEQAKLIQLRYFDGLDVLEVADELNIEVKPYYRKHAKALEAMSLCLGAMELTFITLSLDQYLGKMTYGEKREVVGKSIVPL